MRSGCEWGGGIEMAAAAHLKGVHVLVYETEPSGLEWRRIGTFEPPTAAAGGGGGGGGASIGSGGGGGKRRSVRVVYQGGVHYDALSTALERGGVAELGGGYGSNGLSSLSARGGAVLGASGRTPMSPYAGASSSTYYGGSSPQLTGSSHGASAYPSAFSSGGMAGWLGGSGAADGGGLANSSSSFSSFLGFEI